jgi:hypothetical protein
MVINHHNNLKKSDLYHQHRQHFLEHTSSDCFGVGYRVENVQNYHLLNMILQRKHFLCLFQSPLREHLEKQAWYQAWCQGSRVENALEPWHKPDTSPK